MFPERLTFSIADWVNAWVDALVTNYGDLFRKISDTLLWAIVNLEGLLRATPWWLLLAIVAAIAWHATRRLLPTLVITGLLFLVGAVGLWDKLMQTLALMLVATFISVLIGIPLGILAARSNRLRAVLMPLLDIMQTMPSFVYLIPVLMLFGLGKVPAIFATVIYAAPPLIRLTDLGIRQVDSEVMEAVNAFGANRWQQTVRRAVAAGPAEHHGGDQPDHHDGPVDGGDRFDDRRPRPRRRRTGGHPDAERGQGPGSRPGDRHPRGGDRPHHPGLRPFPARDEQMSGAQMNKIEVKNVFKIFGPRADAALALIRQGRSKAEVLAQTGCVVGVNDLSLSIGAGEIFVIMGLSGSGKSTLVRHFNRLIDPTSGEILVDGEDILRYDIEALRQFRRRKISMVFQSFGLLPHKSVLDNVAYGLKVRGESRAQCHERALHWIATVGLKGYEKSYPHQLSGGMRQRVGLARALAADTEIILMDEAFSALDPLIRADMQDQLLELQKTLHKTIVFITHDLDEAVRIGNRIAILKDGQLIQVGTPREILHQPADDYVDRFVQRRVANL